MLCPFVTLRSWHPWGFRKVFKEVYLERCAGDEQWLEHAAMSNFGDQAIDAVVFWVLSSEGVCRSAGQNPVPVKFELSAGEPWPDLRSVTPGKDMVVQEPTRLEPYALKWRFYSHSRRQEREQFHLRAMTLLEGFRFIPWIGRLRIVFDGRQLTCIIYPHYAAVSTLPCLGLVYLVCKKAAESFNMRCSPSLNEPSGYVRVYLRDWRVVTEPAISRKDMPELPPDAQRAFTAIRMRMWKSGCPKVWVNLTWTL
jgi:hypothetical protein